MVPARVENSLLTAAFGANMADVAAVEELGQDPQLLGVCCDLKEIVNSREIMDLMDLPPVPQNALLVKGVLESAGKSIPLMDLRIRLDAFGRAEDRPATSRDGLPRGNRRRRGTLGHALPL